MVNKDFQNGVCVRVCVYMWLRVWVDGLVCTTKTPDRNVLKLDTVVVLDTLSQPTDFGFKRSRVRVRVEVRESAPIASEESARIF